MITVADFAPYFFLSVLFLILYYVLGHIVSAAVGVRYGSFLEDFFAKNVIGLVLSSSLYAVILTGGRTIFALMIFLSALMIYKNVRENRQPFLIELFIFPKLSLQDLAALFLSFCAITALKIYKSYDPNYGYLAESFLEMDYCLYAQYADYIALTGIENLSRGLNFLSEDYHGITPYHYFELWTAALWKNVSGLNTAYIFIFSLADYVLLMLYTGYNIILRKLISKRKNLFLFFLSFAFLLASSIPTEHFTKIPIESFSQFAFNFLHGSPSVPILDIKRCLVEFYFVVVFVLAVNNERENALLSLLIIPVFSVLLAPACYSGVFLYALFAYIRQNKDTNTKEFLFLPILAVFATAILFYFFKPALSQSNDTLKDVLGTYSSFGQYLIDFLKRTAYYAGSYWAIYMPFSLFVLVYIFRGRFFVHLAWFYSLLFFCGLPALIFGSLFAFFNWEQFFTTYIFAVFKLLFVVFPAAWVFNEFDWRRFKLIPTVLMLVFVWFGFRVIRNMQLKIKPLSAYGEEKRQYFEEIKNSRNSLWGEDEANHAIFYYSKENIAKLPFLLMHNCYGNANYLFYVIPNLQLANFSYDQFHEVNGGKPFEKEIEHTIYTAEINQFIRYQQKQGEYQSLTEAKREYIKKMRVKFAVIDKNAEVEPEIRSLFKDSIENKEDGQKIFILDNQ